MSDDSGGHGVGLDYDPAIYAKLLGVRGENVGTFTEALHSLPAVRDALDILATTSRLVSSANVVEDAQPDTIETFSITLVDRLVGPVPIADVTVSDDPGNPGEYVEVARSRDGAAFSKTGITQVTATTTADGRVSFTVSFINAQWQAGDVARVTFTGGIAVDIGGDTKYPQQTFIWSVTIGREVDNDAAVANDWSHPDGLGEQTAITISAPTTVPSHRINSVILNFINLTQNITVRVKGKVNASVEAESFSYLWKTTYTDILVIKLGWQTRADVLITLQSAIAEGAIRAVPYETYTELRP